MHAVHRVSIWDITHITLAAYVPHSTKLERGGPEKEVQLEEPALAATSPKEGPADAQNVNDLRNANTD